MKGNFQIIILIIFIALAILGLLVFSGVINIGGQTKPGALGTVVLWGTAKAQTVNTALEKFNRANPTFIVKYVQKNPETFDQDLLEAMASRIGPDMFFLPDNLVLSYVNKIYTIPYQSYPLANFKTSFAGAGEVFLTSRGILAFPIAIDPLVMYYNRSILDANSIIYPPKYWDDFKTLVPILTKKDDAGNISVGTIGMGQFSNIAHAKDILSTLFMQTGNSIIAEKGGFFYPVLGNSGSNMQNLDAVLSFYASFSDPLNVLYSWNRAFSNSVDAFSAEKLAFYFGYASELQTLIKKNPNENFLVTSIPQIKSAKFKLTSGRVTGIAISSSSKNLTTALTAASLLATSSFASDFAYAAGIPPARRDLLAGKPTDAYFPIFFNSALYAKAWLDPSPSDTDNIFKNMIDGVLSNSMTVDNAIKDANSKFSLLLSRP